MSADGVASLPSTYGRCDGDVRRREANGDVRDPRPDGWRDAEPSLEEARRDRRPRASDDWTTISLDPRATSLEERDGASARSASTRQRARRRSGATPRRGAPGRRDRQGRRHRDRPPGPDPGHVVSRSRRTRRQLMRSPIALLRCDGHRSYVHGRRSRRSPAPDVGSRWTRPRTSPRNSRRRVSPPRSTPPTSVAGEEGRLRDHHADDPRHGMAFPEPEDHRRSTSASRRSSSTASAARRGSSSAFEWVFPTKPAKASLPGATYGSFGAACHYKDGTFDFQPSQDRLVPRRVRRPGPPSASGIPTW